MILKILITIIFIFLVTSCQSEERSADQIDSNHTQVSKSQISDAEEDIQFVCDYMDQKPSGDVPVKIAIGIISTKKDDSCFEISYSGKEMVFNRDGKIYLSNQVLNK